jgi:hypothetical protein
MNSHDASVQEHAGWKLRGGLLDAVSGVKEHALLNQKCTTERDSGGAVIMKRGRRGRELVVALSPAAHSAPRTRAAPAALAKRPHVPTSIRAKTIRRSCSRRARTYHSEMVDETIEWLDAR